MSEGKKFYLIEVAYIGPYPYQKGHLANRVRISDQAGRKNMSGEPCDNGWLGTTDGWHRQALGKYDEAGARQMLTEIYKIKLPKTSPVRFTEYCHSHKNAEWYNRQFCY